MLKKLPAFVAMLCAATAFAAVDVNKASASELDGVKGIGPVMSKRILAERKKGEFKNWDDLVSRVKGVGPSTATKLSGEGLTVNGEAFKAAAVAKKDEKKEAPKAAATMPAASAAAKPASAKK
ncbi:helix-hairpin-helix domain-containing protein [Ramlibacter terrae]|uniref:Helix-hairpin-helix domain-containing protein n=1 Tax=Ramlibacter terrae TaxID=2732511 RepID=A0ABX6P1Y6_9BURK|nr:helix-hairpin-helix domain-containing protein [Ramlibacter terrae]